MYEIIFIGNSPRIMDAICLIKEIRIKVAFCEEKKMKAMDNSCCTRDVKLIPVAGKKDLMEKISEYYDYVHFAIMYNFGIIVPHTVLSHLAIYNFHPGDLRSNRGSSPINWSILLNEKKTKMTLYKISEEIDLGEVASEHVCAIYESDVPTTLRLRMEGEIPSMLLELVSCLENKIRGYVLREGTYRERITEADFTIADGDDKDTIMGKIRSQYEFEGAVYYMDGIKYHIRSYEEYIDITNKH